MYARAAALGEPRPKMFNGAQVDEPVTIGELTGLPAQTIFPEVSRVALSAFCTFWKTYSGVWLVSRE